MPNEEVVNKTADFVKKRLSSDSTGHDWWHVDRVWRLAKHIAKQEKRANMLVVELGALLHDIADFKLHGGNIDIGPQEARKWLTSLDTDEEIIKPVEEIVREISFKGAGVKQKLATKEGRIVYDADKLDAIGAIGIARAFAFGGAMGRPMHDPSINPTLHNSFEEYKTATPPTINHFYEKLLLLHERMHTETGKKLARRRHKYMESFLKEFYEEWSGNL